ncbi:MAG: hypothetical protein G01um101425_699 [Candidatus Peregrinibacteria bacterium Gr01-1014_25]|nr:MAG: hypothetical protein G01um101425_699 [Candidatus Peregrinibacteria bacterium Gr01-1014_25]
MQVPPAAERVDTTEGLTAWQRSSPPVLSGEHAVDGVQGVPMDRFLPDVNLLRGVAYAHLRTCFKKRVQWNDARLREAWINRHSWDHMDTVAKGVYHLGTRMQASFEDVLAVTLATRFHDIGYEFPKGVLPETLCKEQHKQHAQHGADLFVDKLNELRRTNGSVRDALPWWAERHNELAHGAIRLHSNGTPREMQQEPQSAEEVLPLLPRLLDKLDNSAHRVYADHEAKFSAVPHKSMQHILHCVRQGTRWLMEPPADGARHKSPPDDVFRKLEAYEYGFVHRLVPMAITDQRLHLQDGTIGVQYAVYPSKVESLLGVKYTPADHSRHFDEAYDKSMRNAAEVAQLIRRQLFGPKAKADGPPLRVHLMYEDGTDMFKEYAVAPKTDVVH